MAMTKFFIKHMLIEHKAALWNFLFLDVPLILKLFLSVVWGKVNQGLSIFMQLVNI